MMPNTQGAPSASKTHLQSPTLHRVNTDVAIKPTDEIVAYYKSGVFADPRPKKTFLNQSEILTDSHKRLIGALREECQALYGLNANLKRRTSRAEMRTLHLEVECVNLKQTLQKHQIAYDALQAELEEANRSMSEMDNLMTQSRTKRLNRLSHLAHDDGLSALRMEN